MKQIYSACGIQNPNNTFLMIAVDFIIDQDSFWKEEGISISIIKDWKILHQKYNVIWTIRRRSSFEKIKLFSEIHGLPLHSIYLIRRAGNYTVNYNPAIKDIL